MASDTSHSDYGGVYSKCESLPSHDREARILTGLRVSVARSRLRQIVSEGQLRTGLLVTLSLLFWVGLFILFYRGFDFVVSYVGPTGQPYHAKTVHFVFTLFFASLQVMLVFSAGIILYGGLFSSREMQFLMTLPVRDERLVLYRFQDTLAFSSWGFILLASPMLVAYGLVVGAPWWYYVFTPVDGVVRLHPLRGRCHRLPLPGEPFAEAAAAGGGHSGVGGDRGGLPVDLENAGHHGRGHARRDVVRGDL